MFWRILIAYQSYGRVFVKATAYYYRKPKNKSVFELLSFSNPKPLIPNT